MNLKIGDKATIEYPDSITVTTIIAITPKGYLKTKNGQLWSPSGKLRGANVWSGVSLRPTTQEDYIKIERSKLISKIIKTKLSDLSTESLRQINEIIDKEAL